MTTRIKIDLSGVSEAIKKVIEVALEEGITLSTDTASSFFADFLVNKHLTGGTSRDKLKVRSGQLRRTTTPIKTKKSGDTYTGGVNFGTHYASTHVKDKRTKTTITPKSAKMLAIPLPGSPALTNTGQQRGFSKIRTRYPFLTLIKSKKGNLILADTRSGSIVPYFVLKRSVTIESRINFNEILPRVEDKLIQKFEQTFNRFFKGL